MQKRVGTIGGGRRQRGAVTEVQRGIPAHYSHYRLRGECSFAEARTRGCEQSEAEPTANRR
jgi:hypothetical protein